MQLGFKKTMRAVKLALKAGVVPAIVGSSGIGKTELVKLLAKLLQKELSTRNDGEVLFVNITCSLLQEGDLLLPIPQSGEKNISEDFLVRMLEVYTTAQQSPERAFSLLDSLKRDIAPLVDIDGMNAVIRAIDEDIKKIIVHLEANPNNIALLFLDELNRASVPVQAELMNLVLARELKGFRLDARCHIVVAMNPSNDMDGYGDTNYAVNSGDTAIMDRLVLIDMKAVFEDWKMWAYEDNENGVQNVDTRIIEFLENSQDVDSIFSQPESTGVVTATPRSWETASKLLTEFDTDCFETMSDEVLSNRVYSDDVLTTLFQGSVGAENSLNLVSYLVNLENHMSIAEVLNNSAVLSESLVTKFTDTSEIRRKFYISSIIHRYSLDIEIGNIPYVNENTDAKIVKLLTIIKEESRDNIMPIYQKINRVYPSVFRRLEDISDFQTIIISTVVEDNM